MARSIESRLRGGGPWAAPGTASQAVCSPPSAICSAVMSPRLSTVDDLLLSQAVENRLSTGWRRL
ncbi:hypothetical protein SCWH03_27240 [Streptomyces pacificus]|uniref:Uncharacterized protein n=1 Tax=Streptomyces pacificus TaxID=2705029 RepID=A0A6A0AUF8_9ACTN|nr:hypothetical protein SCWH03_27240 [Streptomyces pacificus]